MARTKVNGDKVDQISFIVYEAQASEWAKALSLVGYDNEKQKSKFLWKLIRLAAAYHKQYGPLDELAALKERTTQAVEKIAASANRTPINLSHENAQVDLEEAIEEMSEDSALEEEVADTTTQFAATDDLIIPPWLDRNKYKEWKEEELFYKIADLESKERNTNEEIELKALNRELESRTE